MAFDTTIPLHECTDAFTQSIIDDIARPLFLLDQEMRILALNPAASRLFALPTTDALHQSLNLLFITDDDTILKPADEKQCWQIPAETRAGRRFMAEVTCSPLAFKTLRRYLLQVCDLDEPAKEHNPSGTRMHADRMLHAISDAVITADANGTVTFANQAACRLFGQHEHTLRGRPLNEVMVFHQPQHNERFEADSYRVLHSGGSVGLDDTAELLRSSNEAIPIDGKLVALEGAKGQVTGCAAVIRDVSAERRMQAVLSFRATHDELTGLVNRREFERRLQEQVVRTASTAESSAMLMIDIDRFKLVNDNYGHLAGDLLLRQLTQIFLGQIRSSDTLARTSGDEFAILLPGCDRDRARSIGDNLRNASAGFRLTWDDDQIAVDISVSIVVIDDHMQSTGDVIIAADSAMLMAKDAGRNCVVVYEPEGHEERRRRGEAMWVTRIRDALKKDRFRLYCQPIVPVMYQTNGSWSCEVLLRMVDDQGELVPPMTFIPTAERYDLMKLIDRWVINAVTEQWRNQPTLFASIEKCNINLSGQSLAQEGFLDFVLDCFDQTGCPFELICFEITETAVVANMENAKRLIAELSARGCRFALDDFGSGLSSFGYLKHLRVDYLKIDGSFVRDMLEEPMDAAMVRAIADIGRTLGLETIAEYVENDAIICELRGAGVDYAQGFGVQRPFPLSELGDYRPRLQSA